uniref:Uncharacterized protein n=1 Tax=Globisporangium ultimum (strain ATCC 200006 / CBS 805.95 / DAOM BR144) TaxID=431595 RepID=K3WKH9_GLOUD
MSKIPTVQKQLKHAKTSSTRGASLLGKGGSPEREFDATKNAATTSSTAMPRSHYEHDKRLTRKKSIDEQHECTSDDDASLVLDMPLAEQVEKFHPELLPLLHPHSLPDQHHSWKLDDVVDAVKLSFFLQDRLLCLPELNRNSPCYSARSIVLLYTKIKYLESFAPEQIAEYAGVGQQEYDEVRLLHQLKNVSSNAEMFSRLATLLHIPCHGDMWNEIIKFVACALPFAEQTESLLIRGSDERSVLCPSAKTNKYNGSTVPLSTDIARASCTCSSITLEGFQRCEKLRQELLLNSLSINPNSQSATEYFDAKMADVRHRIASSLGVTDLVQDGTIHVLLTPSGTDAELLATSAAFARMFSGLESLGGGSTRKKITSIISAQGEIGRGSASASGGKHFSELTPSGEPAVPGEPLRRYPTELVDVLELHGRDDDGNIKCIDEYVFQTVTRLLEDSEGPSVVLLHVVMGSKTGFNSPTMEIVDLLAATYPNRLLVVVDACQMRVNLRAFREFSAKGYITLVTGSKFFGGAPFCGAVLMPIRCVYEMETTAVEEHAELCHPLGLEDYFSKYEFPACMKHVRARLGRSNQFMNVGLLLRWESALAHMEPYAAIPHASVDAICRTYVTRTKQQLQSAKCPLRNQHS